MASEIAGFAVIVFVALLWMAHVAARRIDQMDAHRRNALDHFRQLVVNSSDARFRFDGATATIVTESESYYSDDDGKVDTYTMTRIARNAYGEYFLVLSGTGPYFKHLSPQMARVVLKEKYIAQDQTFASESDSGQSTRLQN